MKRIAMLSLLFIMLGLGVMLWGYSDPPPPAPARVAPQALLLVESDTGSYLMQLRLGLQESLQARGVTLRVERAADMDLSAPDAFAGADILYLHAADPAALLARLPQGRPPTVVLGHALRGEICVLPDLENGGWQAGLRVLLQRPAGSILIVGDENDPAQALRLQGAQRGLGRQQAQVMTLAQAEAADWPRLGAVLALSGEDTRTLAEWKQAGRMPEGLPLFGFDAEDSRVTLLEGRLLQGVVAENAYALGYLAGELQPQLRTLRPSLHLAPVRLVTLDSLYDAENVKLMFPLLN